MEYKGIISKIYYQSPQNHWCSLKVELSDGKKMSCTGICPGIVVGQRIKFKAEEYQDKQYGAQLKIKEYTQVMSEDKDSIISFLSNGYLKHIGPATAEKLYELFGEDVFKIIEHEPLRLEQVKGITNTKALEISDTYKEHKNLKELNTLLYPSGITPNMCMKIYKSLKEFNTIELIHNDPYCLIKKVDGIGFLKADHFAMNAIRLPENSPKRIEAAIIYTLEQFCRNTGHLYMLLNEVIEECLKLVRYEVTGDYITNVLRKMIREKSEEKNAVVMRIIDDSPVFYFKKFYNMEIKLSENLKRLVKPTNKKIYDDSLMKTMRNHEKKGFKLSDEQRSAIKNILDSQVSILTGGPGTGKSTITKVLLDTLKDSGHIIGVCAPTGRASKKVMEITNYETKTIHRFLAWREGVFAFNEKLKFSYDAIIIDECSMISLDLFHYLVRAMKDGTKIIFIGDVDQLPPIGVGSVFKDLMSWDKISVTRLTKIFRQSEGSAIIHFAHEFNKGEIKIPFATPISVHGNECSFMPSKNLSSYTESICDLYSELMDEDTQILCPMRISDIGTVELNNKIQERVNPFIPGDPEIRIGKKCFRVGDRVIQTENNYDLNVFNGDIGYIREMTDKKIVVQMLEDLIEYTKSEMMQLELAYAITIHKSQGSEFDNVIIPVFKKSMIMLSKNLVYTAATRAKKKVSIIGEYQAMILASKKSSTFRRSYLNTLLNEENSVESIKEKEVV